MLVSRVITELTLYSTLAWFHQSSGLNKILGRWDAVLSKRKLEIRQCEKDEDDIIGTLAASIAPRQEVDEMLIAIAPRKQPRKTISIPPPTVEEEEDLWVARIDGFARLKRKGGDCSTIVWRLPG